MSKPWTSTKSPDYDRNAIQRLLHLSDKGENGCRVWAGPKTGSGYGCFSYRGRNRAAHRVAYELLVGPIPEGFQLDHLCRNRACIETNHLEPVTRLENVRRGQRPKLTIEQARDIRNTLAGPVARLLREYDVNPRTLMRIALGEAWLEDDQAMKERK